MVTLIVLVLVVGAIAVYVSRQNKLQRDKRAAATAADLASVKKITDEDVTALGEELQLLDSDLLGDELDEGERADYQRALDSYESAKEAVDQLTSPDQVRHVTEILEDGRYAIACVRARVTGTDLPTRRPPCFFDPRHGMSVEDVTYAPAGGAERDVPACALDAQRVNAGAEPDIRKVMVGPQRVPYWQGGRAYGPYTAGYFSAFDIIPALFVGTMIGSMFDGGSDGGYDSGYDAGFDAGQDSGDGGGGDGFGGGDGGGGDGGSWLDGFGDGGGGFGNDGGGFDGGGF